MNRYMPNRAKVKSIDLALLLLAFFAYRVWLLTQPWVGVYHDEAYYFHWSLIPDFGYYSKPPMIAWVIGLSSSLFGAGAFGIKLGPAICWFLSGLTIAAIARHIWDGRTGWLAGVIFYTTPLAGFYSLFATTDSVLLLCWSLSLLGFIKAQRAHSLGTENLSWWLLAGLATGLGLLSKYTLITLPFAYLLFMLANARRRAQFGTLGPWMAGLVALALFSLNIFWNITNDFVAWRHTSEIAQIDEGSLLNPLSMITFWLEQVAIFGLISTLLIIRWREKIIAAVSISEPLQVIVLASSVLFVGISVQALLSRAFANWAAPVIVGLTFALVVVARQHPKAVLSAITFNLLLLSGFYHWPQAIAALGIDNTKQNNPWLRVEPWAERLAAEGRFPAGTLDLPIASDSRAILANLTRVLQPGVFPSRYWENDTHRVADYYDQTINFDSLPRQGRWLFATDHPMTTEQRRSFQRVTFHSEVPSYYQWRPGKTLFLYSVENFNGY